jgi:hypothetical protein
VRAEDPAALPSVSTATLRQFDFDLAGFGPLGRMWSATSTVTATERRDVPPPLRAGPSLAGPVLEALHNIKSLILLQRDDEIWKDAFLPGVVLTMRPLGRACGTVAWRKVPLQGREWRAAEAPRAGQIFE